MSSKKSQEMRYVSSDDEEMNRFSDDEEEEIPIPVEFLTDCGISDKDVQKLIAAGIYSCDELLRYSKKDSSVAKDLSGAKVDKIFEAAETLLGKDKVTRGSPNEVLVKNLPYQYDEPHLKGQLKRYGEVVKVEPVLENGLFTGSVKAVFQSSEDARKALAFNGTTFYGRELKLEISGEEQEAELPFVVVKHLPRDISVREVKAHFSKSGDPSKLKLTKVYAKKHRSAFIHYASKSSIDAALLLNRSTIREQEILVEVGRSDKSRGQFGSSSGPIRRSKDKGARGYPY